MTKNHWVVSRPKRKLILVPTILNIFASTTEGKAWAGNRSLHKRFEQNITTSQWKAQNISKDGSGGRTYAVLLFLLGLWYEDKHRVQITNAGRELLDGNPAVPILTKQLLDFQYPSPYSLKPNVNVSRQFRVQPHRLVLRLFLEKNFKVITKDEIAFCLVPFAKRNEELDECASRITDYRKSKDEIIHSALATSGASIANLRDIGNTVINQMEYTGYFEGITDISQLAIRAEKKREAIEYLAHRRKSLIQKPEDEVQFQTRYGAGLLKTKDYRRSRRDKIDLDPNDRLVIEKFYTIASNEPINSISRTLIERISNSTGILKEKVSKVLNYLPVNMVVDQFEQSYLQLSKGGKSTYLDFELRTTAIFSDEGFGLASDWVGNKPRHPDVIIYIDAPVNVHGIIDTKAYSEYSLPLDHKNKMAHTYIPGFRQLEYKQKKTELSFFCYVAGGYSPTMRMSFNELLSMTDKPGSYITAENLMRLLRSHKESQLTTDEFLKYFSSGGEITYEKFSGR
jgi:hypothetical protein